MEIFNLDPEQYKTECIPYEKNPSEIVIEKVNFGEIKFDYLVIYNNPIRYETENYNSNVFKMAFKSYTNVCIYNNWITPIDETTTEFRI
jgi:hypothetical protein